jgi:hypothetical protein
MPLLRSCKSSRPLPDGKPHAESERPLRSQPEHARTRLQRIVNAESLKLRKQRTPLRAACANPTWTECNQFGPSQSALRTSSTVQQKMQVYVEIHSYDGGFISRLIPDQQRPTTLPTTDQVGLRSNEVELAPNDYALELALFDAGGHRVIWLGCYTRGTDLKYGDRGTYCGIGVWLVDANLIHSLHLVRFLQNATAKIAVAHHRIQDVLAKLETFANDFHHLGWCAPIAQSDARLESVNTNEQRNQQTSYLVLPDNQQTSFDLVGIDILRQSVGKHKLKTNSRRLYILASHSRIYVPETDHIEYTNALTYAEQVIHSVVSMAPKDFGSHVSPPYRSNQKTAV